MEFTLTTPSLLFSTISLLLLAYTNRFLTLASIIRQLHAMNQDKPNPVYVAQISNLRRRIRLIRDMQFTGVLSILLCTVCMTLLFLGCVTAAKIVFGVSLASMIVSLLLSLTEISMSVRALDLHLKDIESHKA